MRCKQEPRAFTLIEILVVVGIIAVLASLMMPAIHRARLAAKITASKGNLRQIYIGTMLYREEQGSTSEFGHANAMGLPWMVGSNQDVARQVAPAEVWRSPCCCHKDGFNNSIMQYTEFMHTDDFWERYSTTYRGDAVMFFDAHCNDSNTDLYRPRGSEIRLVGVRLNGAIETRVRRVSMSDTEAFWHY